MALTSDTTSSRYDNQRLGLSLTSDTTPPGNSSNNKHDTSVPGLQGSRPEGIADFWSTGTSGKDDLPSTYNLPKIELETPSTASPTPKDSKPWLSSPSKSSAFPSLSLDFGTKGFGEEIGSDKLNFSARGSMLIEGKKVNGGLISAKTMPVIQEPVVQREMASTTRKRAVTSISERPQTRFMSTDEEQLSEKVRSYYLVGTDAMDGDSQSATAQRMNLRWQDAVQENRDSMVTASRATSMTDVSKLPPSLTIPREYTELAGGLEDWQDIEGGDVDRYGFIVPRSPTSPKSTNGCKRSPTGNGPGLQRVSTALQLASETPRRKHTIRRNPSNARSYKSDHEGRLSPSNQSMKSSKSLNLHRHASASRTLANKFPHNRDRKLMDEASDMLTLPRPGTAGTLNRAATEDTNGTHLPNSSVLTSKKELERQAKWQRMAKDVPVDPKTGPVGGGTTHYFDTTSVKLIERTWKGIPDSWRASAWYCFLAASVTKHNKKHPQHPCLTDSVLTEMFQEYQNQNSPDDVQIDIDVPRTISSHIMFRRRYRGGQRLLFRVLHAMSMHFAEIGYVQGMAALAATLLAYYEEEKAFIMLVRLWELRGLEKLYKHGFGGLMEALDDFENHWLGQGELRKKLDDLNVGPTAYGTRWYLTLFNYSIPFPSQLRVWDVFMLLGDDESDQPHANNDKANFGTTLDVLHAASAALIDGMRGILIESDFETAMKVLTSWIPIRDEDLFMRVARAEWKMHRQRNGKKS